MVQHRQRPRCYLPRIAAGALHLHSEGKTEESGLGECQADPTRDYHQSAVLAHLVGLHSLHNSTNNVDCVADALVQTPTDAAQLARTGKAREPAEAGTERGTSEILHQHNPRTAHSANAHPRSARGLGRRQATSADVPPARFDDSEERRQTARTD